MSIRSRAHRAVACCLLFAPFAMAACKKQDDTGNDPRVGKLRQEVIVDPNYPGEDTAYFRFDPGFAGGWERVYPTAKQLANHETVQTLSTTPPASSRLADAGILGVSSAVLAESTVVALFAGGVGSTTTESSRKAALYRAGETPLNLQMTVGRSAQSMSRLAGQRILIAGGYGSATTVLRSSEIFSLSSLNFTASGLMRIGRASHAAATLPDGRVLITGGLVLVGAGPATQESAATELFDPAAGTFSDGPSLLSTRASHSAVSLADGRVLIVGGFGKRTAEVYTPSTGQITSAGQTAIVHGDGHVALLLANGKVLVIGGNVGGINPTPSIELFDPTTGTFTTAGNLTVPRMRHSAVLLVDGTVLIAGGRTTGGDALRSAELFNPATGQATPVANMPSATFGHASALVTTPDD